METILFRKKKKTPTFFVVRSLNRNPHEIRLANRIINKQTYERLHITDIQLCTMSSAGMPSNYS